jgi:biofilm protein TabA
MKKLTYVIVVLFITISSAHINLLAQTTAQDTWTKEKAGKWFLSNKWQNGLKLKAHESIDKLEFAKQYHKNKALWDKAFAYLRDTDLEKLAPGKYPIEGNDVFASVTEGPTKDIQNAKCESHIKYIDLQYVIKGKEKMGVSPVSEVKNIAPYDSTKDIAFYDGTGNKFYEAKPGTFFIFFPNDAHRPGVKVDGCDTDKKIVIKIVAAK